MKKYTEKKKQILGKKIVQNIIFSEIFLLFNNYFHKRILFLAKNYC